ncbi:hypothetical protein MLD38_025887 [Melastoma candidum]|uniref:Uncharacterized protein n=1 Tax=Melastoma candidum TaxID=119954 RepID=A0ACB9NWV2_9MYRT|nr:hypothetical protein MLD38_025887 [Melastoma candidum]
MHLLVIGVELHCLVLFDWNGNMMELGDNQLDFSQPLLTVRRFSPAIVPPETLENRRVDRTTANLPPLPRYKSDLKSGPVRNPGTVPFVWEQTPGRPKDEGKSLNPIPKAHVVPPKPPPGKHSKRRELNKINQEVESDKEKNSTTEDEIALKCKRVDDVLEESSEIDDETFLDALETFSRSESQYLSCSLSGLSGVDAVDSRLSGRFSKEQPARDFMMGRFLPAAKAMASEAPANVIRKPQAQKDLPRHLANSVTEGKNNTQRYQRKYNVHFVNDRYGFGQDSEADFDEYENPSTKMCGLLPRFCQSNAISSITVPSASSTYSLRRLQVKSSYAQRQGENWCKDGDFSRVRKSDGNFLADKSEPKAVSGRPISEGDDNSVKDAVIVENSKNEEHSKPQGRRCMNFRQLLASEGSEWESGSKVTVAEKTVYVNAVQVVESRNSGTSASDSRAVTESASDEYDKEKNCVMRKCVNGDSSALSSSVEKTSSNITRKDTPPSADTTRSAESWPLPASKGGGCDSEITADVVGGLKHEVISPKLPEAEATSIDGGKDGPEISPIIDGKIDLEGEINPKPGDPLIIPGIYTDFPIPPPLPKSPVDSWLSRTLPSMLSKNSGKILSFGVNALSKVHLAAKSAPVDPKWETIVKSANVDRGHLRFSEELLAPIPESCTGEH